MINNILSYFYIWERENNIRPVNHINLLLKCVTLSRLTWDIGMCFQFLTPFHDVLMISFSWVTNVIASTRKRFVFICAVIILQSLNKVFNNQDCVKSPTRGSLPWLLYVYVWWFCGYRIKSSNVEHPTNLTAPIWITIPVCNKNKCS